MSNILLQINWDSKDGVAVILSGITLVPNLVIYFKTRREVRHNQSVTSLSGVQAIWWRAGLLNYMEISLLYILYCYYVFLYIQDSVINLF
jgi:hypothetical protein